MSAQPTHDPTGATAAERSALRDSAVAGAVLGSAAVLWGLATRSGVVLFDGVYTLAGIALVAVSAAASHAAGSGPTARYPFGRHAATPLAVAMQGAALTATLVYGVADAVGTLLSGGSTGDSLPLLVYGAGSTVISLAAAWWVRRRGAGSELAQAEVVSWRAGAALSAVIAVGGVVGLVLERAGLHEVAVYVDPALLLLAVALVSPMAVQLVRDGMHELLEGVPPAPLAADLDRIVAGFAAERGLPEPVLRATKLGRRLYVEVDFVVAPGRWAVDEEDVVRRDLIARLDTLPADVWANVELTTDPALAV
jgi:predicted Co/Zn/Cd cation transporter (cation efflux family)